ncbi:MAG: HD domain-containing phosphohydrolase [Actinomycetota bacterium]|nr:HD domain-containing phosphohydrolase [Actinomycetota bacterium]
MDQQDLRGLLRRDVQLNALSSVITIALLGMVIVLAYAVLTGLDMAQPLILDYPLVTLGAIGLLLAVIAYMAEQHRNLRGELIDAHTSLEKARDDVVASYERLAFAHEVAAIAGMLEHGNAVDQVLRASLEHYDADAAALVSDESNIIVRDPRDTHQANSAMVQASLAAVRTGEPVSVGQSGGESASLSIPLRIRGRLSAVLCLWRQSGRFADEHVDGLGLIGRVLELAMENRMLLAETREQLGGTLRTLSHLIDKRVPKYADHATRVAAHAVSVGMRFGLTGGDLVDLRAASILMDVGMLDLPDHLLDPHRLLSEEEWKALASHPDLGAEFVAKANLPHTVQEAVRYHHESMNGSGFPHRIAGTQIPFAARIIAACDAYESLIRPRSESREPITPDAAAREIAAQAGYLYDAEVVRALLKTLADERGCAQAARATAPENTAKVVCV